MMTPERKQALLIKARISTAVSEILDALEVNSQMTPDAQLAPNHELMLKDAVENMETFLTGWNKSHGFKF
jgi:hypothetical protein